MAYASTNTNQPATRPSLGRFFAAIGTFFVNMAESDSRLRQVQALNALSDEELAKRGLAREDITHFVFGRYFY